MIDLTAKQAYTELYRALLLHQFKNAEDIGDVLDIKGGNLNDTEALYFDSIQAYFWENAEGAQLDTLGKIIGFARQGRSDSNYATILRLKIQLNVSGGTIPVLLDAIDVIFNASFIQYVQDFNDYRPVAKILTDGDVNLFTEYQAITEDGLNNLAFNIFGDSAAITEDGNYFLAPETGGVFVLEANIVEYGADMVLTESDDLDETVLYEALPAGVGLYFMSFLVSESGTLYFSSEDDKYFIV